MSEEQKEKEWRKWTELKVPMGHHQMDQHVHNGNSRRGKW